MLSGRACRFIDFFNNFSAAFQHLAFVINGAPQIVCHSINFHKHLVQVPAPVFASAHHVHAFTPEFRGKQRTKPVPPVAHRFMTNLNPTLMKQVFDIAQRQREPNDSLTARRMISGLVLK
jgi:hypothetical protein